MIKRNTYRVSIRYLYNFENLLQRQMKRQTSGNYYKMTRVYLSFPWPHLIHLCISAIRCTKLIKTLLDFLHDRCFPRMFLVLPLSNTIPVSINFLCHARIDERDGGSLPYLVLKFRRVCRSNLVSINALCLLLSSSHFLMGSFNSIVIHQLEYLKCNVIKTSITTEYIEQI